MWFYFLTVLTAGALLPLQAGLNAGLARSTGHPIWAAGASFAIGTLVLLAVAVALRVPLPNLGGLAGAPAWSWSGGLLGAFYVTAMTILAPKLGAVTLLALVIVGQMGAAALLDHFGAAGFAQHSLNGWRILGIVLLMTGAVLVRRF